MQKSCRRIKIRTRTAKSRQVFKQIREIRNRIVLPFDKFCDTFHKLEFFCRRKRSVTCAAKQSKPNRMFSSLRKNVCPHFKVEIKVRGKIWRYLQTRRRGEMSGLLFGKTILDRTLNEENGAQTEKQIARDGAAGTRRATYPEPRQPKRSLWPKFK